LRHRFVFAAVFTAGVALSGIGTAHAAPVGATDTANHGQCVSNSPQPSGPGGRSVVAKDKSTCGNSHPTLTCTENEDGGNTVVRNSADDTVTITGSGAGSAGSSLECTTAIPVTAGQTVSFSYTLPPGTNPCGAGVPRLFVVIGGSYYNTIDADPECAHQTPGTVTYTIPVTGTVTQVGFVYDRGDTGSVTYSNATIGGVALNI
jgi:hypothetical protein